VNRLQKYFDIAKGNCQFGRGILQIQGMAPCFKLLLILILLKRDI